MPVPALLQDFGLDGHESPRGRLSLRRLVPEPSELRRATEPHGLVTAARDSLRARVIERERVAPVRCAVSSGISRRNDANDAASRLSSNAACTQYCIGHERRLPMRLGAKISDGVQRVRVLASRLR